MTKPMRNPTPQERKQFHDACETLNKLGKKGFYLYLATDNMNLMTGRSHDESGQRQDLVAESHWICGSGGGDW